MIFPVAILPFLCGITSALVHGIDTSALISTDTYMKALGEGFTHLVINGYEGSCATGGNINPNFVANYRNAEAAGYKSIDASWFPCTGTLNKCKTYPAQLEELRQTIRVNRINLGHIWLQLETDSACDSWNYGTNGNLAEAKKLVDALKSSGENFGIYSTPGEWAQIFGSTSVVVDATLPLWFATYDNLETLELRRPFGGWNKAFGKQYSDESASGNFGLNVFAA